MFYLKKPPKRLIKVTIVVKRSNCALGSDSRYQRLDRLNNCLFVDVFIVRSTVLSDDYHNELMEWKKEERKKGWTAFWDAFLQQKDRVPKASVIYTNKIQLGPDVNSIRYMSNNKLRGLDKFTVVIMYFCYVKQIIYITFLMLDRHDLQIVSESKKMKSWMREVQTWIS